MRWWIRSQHPLWAMGITLVGTIGVAFSPDFIGLPVPSLGGPSAFASIRPYALVAVLITVGTWASVSAGHKSAVLAATRAVRLYVLALLGAICAVCSVTCGALVLLFGGSLISSQLLLRDVLGLLGLGLLLVPYTGYRFAGIASTVYVFMSAIFGRTDGGDAAFWAWPISESTDLSFWIPVIVLCVLGTGIWVARSRGHYPRTLITQAMDAGRE